jgi:hypothetical protein
MLLRHQRICVIILGIVAVIRECAVGWDRSRKTGFVGGVKHLGTTGVKIGRLYRDARRRGVRFAPREIRVMTTGRGRILRRAIFRRPTFI